MASRMALRSDVKRPRIRTTFDVIVSDDMADLLVVQEQLDELCDFEVVYVIASPSMNAAFSRCTLPSLCTIATALLLPFL